MVERRQPGGPCWNDPGAVCREVPARLAQRCRPGPRRRGARAGCRGRVARLCHGWKRQASVRAGSVRPAGDKRTAAKPAEWTRLRSRHPEARSQRLRQDGTRSGGTTCQAAASPSCLRWNVADTFPSLPSGACSLHQSSTGSQPVIPPQTSRSSGRSDLCC